VTKDSDESDLDDTVTLTIGTGKGDVTSSSVEVDATKVESDFTASKTYEGKGSDVTIKKITTDKVYYNATIDTSSNPNIIDTKKIKAVSSITTFSASELAALGLTGSGSYKLTTVTAPTMTVSIADNIEATTPLSGYTGKTVYFYDGATNDYPTVKKVSSTIDGTTDNWTFMWIDETVDASGTVTATNTSNTGTAQEAASLSDLELKAVGHHKVYLAAYYNGATTPTAKSETLEFYVIKDNPTTISYSGSITYTGEQIAEPTPASAPNPNVTPTYSYYLTAGGSEDDATSGLPTDAGSYTVVANFPEDLNLGLKKTKQITTVTVDKATIKIDAGETDVEAYTEENKNTVYEVSLKDFIKDYEKNTSDTKEKSGEEFSTSSVTYVGDITYVTASKKLTYKLTNSATGGNNDTISGTIETTNYELEVTYKVNVAAAGTEVLNITAKDLTTYFKDFADATEGKTAIEDQIQNKRSDGTYTISYVAQDATGGAESNPYAKVGTYTVKISYSRAENTQVQPNVKAATGKGTLILTVEKKPLTITAQAQTINVGDNFKAYTYTVSSDVGKTVSALPSGLQPTATVYKYGTTTVTTPNTKSAGKYTLDFTISGSDVDSYEITTQTATLMVRGKDGSTGSGDSNEEGSATNPVVNVELKTVDGVLSLVTDDGTVLKSQFATVNGKLYYADATGAVQTGKIFTAANGKLYYATKKGVIRKNGVYDIVGGGKIYARADGTLLVSGSKVIDGDRYVADKNGKLVKSGFTTTAKGYRYCMKNYVAIKNKVFTHTDGKTYIANKNGTIQKGNKIVTFGGKKYYVYAKGSVAKNKVVTVSGKKYVANKKGVLVINGKYTIGKKTYTTNKKGVITKTTTKK
jgi:hypothetical protein